MASKFNVLYNLPFGQMKQNKNLINCKLGAQELLHALSESHKWKCINHVIYNSIKILSETLLSLNTGILSATMQSMIYLRRVFPPQRCMLLWEDQDLWALHL